MWVHAQNVHVRACKHLHLAVLGISLREGDKLPKGQEVNPNLADETSPLRKEIVAVIANGGEKDAGPCRVLNGGGVYGVPANLIDMSASDGSTHDAEYAKLCQKFGGEPEWAYPVVFRDWGAPGTFGVFDGGGAGRGERIPETVEDFLVRHCLSENLGEIGLLVHRADHMQGRVSYTLPNALSSYNEWLENHIVREWVKSHRAVPPSIATATLKLESLPDQMDIDGVGEVNNVKLTFEFKSAAIECLVKSSFELDLPEGARLRFIDLESGKGKGLNRRIGIVVQRGERLALISYYNGQFDTNFPAIPITKDTVEWCGNAKFAAVISMIRANGR